MRLSKVKVFVQSIPLQTGNGHAWIFIGLQTQTIWIKLQDNYNSK